MPPAKPKKPFTPKLERFLATVAYDGTDHIGWQARTGERDSRAAAVLLQDFLNSRGLGS